MEHLPAPTDPGALGVPDYIDAEFRDTRPIWRRWRPRAINLFAHRPDIMAKDYNGGLYVPPKPFWWAKRTWKEWGALIFIGGPVAIIGIMWACYVIGQIAHAVHH